MTAPIIAAYEPFPDDRAPVVLALAAARLTGAPVLAAAVYPWPISVHANGPPLPGEPDSQAILRGAVRRLHEDLDVETRIVIDLSVPHGLHALARDEAASLIVVGSTSRGGAEHVLIGSTAERLLHGAPCPVALAPRGYVGTAMETIAI